MRKQTSEPKHYLISVPFAGGYGHAYMLTSKKENGLKAVEKITQEGIKRGLIPGLPISLETHMDASDKGVNIVREVILNETDEKTKTQLIDVWANPKNKFFFILWYMAEDHPDNKRLMAVH